MKTNVVIVGAGPAGIFTAIEMIRGCNQKIVIWRRGERSKTAPARRQRRGIA